MLFLFLSFFIISFVNIKNRRYRFLFFSFCFFGVLGLIYLIANTTVFSFNETSNSIKAGHVESFIDYVSENPRILLFGAGTGSSYYSKGFEKITWQTEVTIIDMIRYFGLIFTCILLFVMMFPLKKSIMNVPFLMYFLDATTNPLIFCSTGMLVITLYYSLATNKSVNDSLSLYDKRKRNYRYVFLHYFSNL